jgi:hypothetical protein
MAVVDIINPFIWGVVEITIFYFKKIVYVKFSFIEEIGCISNDINEVQISAVSGDNFPSY